MIIVWKWRCSGCHVEIETSQGQVPAECSCGATEWLKISESKKED